MTRSKRTMTYHHLQPQDLGIIQAMLAEGRTAVDIAGYLGVHRSTIYREIQRGTVRQYKTGHIPLHTYLADTAQIVYKNHRQACHKISLTKKCPCFFEVLNWALKGPIFASTMWMPLFIRIKNSTY